MPKTHVTFTSTVPVYIRDIMHKVCSGRIIVKQIFLFFFWDMVTVFALKYNCIQHWHGRSYHPLHVFYLHANRVCLIFF